MFINHLVRYFPNISSIVKYTYASMGIFTSAEIFIALSAYAAGKNNLKFNHLIFGKSSIRKKLLNRFFKLYLVHIGMLALVIILSAGTTWVIPSQTEVLNISLITKFFYGCILLFQPPLLDILPMYLLFTLLTPSLLSPDKKRVFLVLLISFSTWLLLQCFTFLKYQRFTGNYVLPYFNIAGWQFLYCVSVVVFSAKIVKDNLRICGIISFIVCFLLYYFLTLHDASFIEYNYLTSRTNMGIFRLLNVVCIGVLCLSLNFNFNKYKIVSPFSKMGANSLLVFFLHAIVFYINHFYIYRYAYRFSTPAQIATFISLVCIPLVCIYIIDYFRAK